MVKVGGEMEWGSKNCFVVARNTERFKSQTTDSLSLPQPIPASLMEVLPTDIIEAVLTGYTLVSKENRGLLEEIRLRANRKASLTVGGTNHMLNLTLHSSELFSLLTRLCGGSLYAYSQNINEGFVTLPGGVRVGVVGTAACEDSRVVGVRDISALCIRIPHAHSRVGREVAELLRQMQQQHGDPRGLLLYAPPGVGKTTLLRGVAAHLSGGAQPWRTVVVDTRGELSFMESGDSLCLDVLSGYPRSLGISIATRSMGAQVIICDEIGDSREAMSLMSAYHGGVPLVATAHGQTVEELLKRTGIRILHRAEIFGAYVGLRRNGTGGFFYDITHREEVRDDL